MKTVNYCILGEIFGLLERIELIDRIPFKDFDPDDACDVRHIAERFILPSLRLTSDRKQEAIRFSIEYYCTSDSAPFQLLRDRCQELTLPDAQNWSRFFCWIGDGLFGARFSSHVVLSDYIELLDDQEAQTIFSRLEKGDIAEGAAWGQT